MADTPFKYRPYKKYGTNYFSVHKLYRKTGAHVFTPVFGTTMHDMRLPNSIGYTVVIRSPGSVEKAPSYL